MKTFKKLSFLTLFFTMLALTTNAKAHEELFPKNFGQNLHIQCELHTRVVVGELNININLEKGYLSYSFSKFNATKPSEDYGLSGSNQDGFGTSMLSTSDVSFSSGTSLNIKANGKYYDRASLVDETHINISLRKIPNLERYQLISFIVDNETHILNSAYCKFFQK